MNDKHRSNAYWTNFKSDMDSSEHLWFVISTDLDCYIAEKDCLKSGEKRCCSGCHVVVHSGCVHLLHQLNFRCRTTFIDSAFHRADTNGDVVKHHWVCRRKQQGRCHQCGKSFQQRMFRKKIIAIVCSWCKENFHNRTSCLTQGKLTEDCGRGELAAMIVPPSWVIRLTGSLRRKKVDDARRKSWPKVLHLFIVKPMDQWSLPTHPLLVFLNTKSGGNKGVKTLRALCWLLNPRQVFDITAMNGPRFGLEMYRKLASKLQLFVCGGDGTVGWVLNTLDRTNWPVYPPMELLPLGTGNDLSWLANPFHGISCAT